MANDGLDGGTALHQFYETVSNATFLALGSDAELVGVGSVVALVRVTRQCHRMQRELAVFGALRHGGNRDIDTKLARLGGLALAAAFDLRRMQAIAFPGFIASFCVITREANHKQCLSVAPALGYLEKNETVASAQKLKFDFILPTAKTSLSTPLALKSKSKPRFEKSRRLFDKN